MRIIGYSIHVWKNYMSIQIFKFSWSKTHWSGARKFWEGGLGALWNRSPPRNRWLESIRGNVLKAFVDIPCVFKGSPNFETRPHAVAMYMISPCDLTKSSLIGSHGLLSPRSSWAGAIRTPQAWYSVRWAQWHTIAAQKSNTTHTRKQRFHPKTGPFRKERLVFQPLFFRGGRIWVFFSGCTLKSANQVQVSHLFLMKS